MINKTSNKSHTCKSPCFLYGIRQIAAWQKPHEVSNQLAQVLAGVFLNPMAPSSDTLEALFPHLAHNQKQNKQNTFPLIFLKDDY